MRAALLALACCAACLPSAQLIEERLNGELIIVGVRADDEITVEIGGQRLRPGSTSRPTLTLHVELPVGVHPGRLTTTRDAIERCLDFELSIAGDREGSALLDLDQLTRCAPLPDAGPGDAGQDAGQDAGPEDAGPADAGPVLLVFQRSVYFEEPPCDDRGECTTEMHIENDGTGTLFEFSGSSSRSLPAGALATYAELLTRPESTALFAAGCVNQPSSTTETLQRVVLAVDGALAETRDELLDLTGCTEPAAVALRDGSLQLRQTAFGQ